MNENLKSVEIYTDGACLGNPGSGGYGVILRCNGVEKELSEGFKNTTNNRMELTGVIMGLKSLKEKCNVTIYSDSQYVGNGIEKGWAKKWRANGWMRNKKEPALNPDLWEQLLDLIEQHNVKIIWVKGHAGHTENEKCDFLATGAAKNV
jgi:ribonuclease HI